jgi:hypothetical protein
MSDATTNSVIIRIDSAEPIGTYYFTIPEEEISVEEYCLLDNLEINSEYIDSKNKSFADIVGNYMYHKYYDYIYEPYEDESVYSIDIDTLNELYPPNAEDLARLYKLCSGDNKNDKDSKNSSLKWVYKPKKQVTIDQELIDKFTIDFEEDDECEGEEECEDNSVIGTNTTGDSVIGTNTTEDSVIGTNTTGDSVIGTNTTGDSVIGTNTTGDNN